MCKSPLIICASAAVLSTCGVSCAPPPAPAGPIDLVVEQLSIYATMPDPNGERQVTASFRIVNRGTTPAPASIVRVQSADGATIIGTPALGRGVAAFFASTAVTTSSQFDITVEADVLNQVAETSETNNVVTYAFGEGPNSTGRWRPIGPSKILLSSNRVFGVGRITTIAVDPFNTSVIYAGARGTGLWKTFDGGQHWQPLTDAIATANINAVAVDPGNPARVYIATPGGVFGSVDSGRSWIMLSGQNLKPIGHDGGALIVHPADPRRLYLSTEKGLRISQDGGVTWGPAVVGATGTIQSFVATRSDPNVYFVTVVESPDAGVWVTDDGGLATTSWRKLQGCAQGPIPAIPATGAGAWFAHSGVTQWLSIKVGPSHELWRTSSRACVVNGRFERVWEKLSAGDQVPCITKDPNRRSNWSFLIADPIDHNVLYKGGTNLCRSTDGGQSFSSVDPGNIHADHHALVFHPAAPGVILLGNDGGLYRTDNGGQRWAFRSEGLAVTEFLDIGIFGAPPRIVTGGAQDNLLSSTDGSSPVWHDVDLGSDLDGDRTMVVVDPLDVDVQYTIGQAIDHFSKVKGGHRDGGFDTSHMSTGCTVYDERPTLNAELIATSVRDFHLITTSGVGQDCTGGNGLWTGPPWRKLFAPPPGEVLMRVLHDPAEGLFLAGGSMGSIFVNFTPDAMAKVFTASGGSVTSIIRDGSRPATYFVALSKDAGGGRIYEISPEAPLRFKGRDITANLPATLVMTLVFNQFEPTALYAGTRGAGVFRGVRDAAGQWTWQAFNNGMPQGALVTKLKAGNATIYASTFGRGTFVLGTVSVF
jgi:photosystem II stability/assembly factor-like uncharacterized protein